jgi:hypothetical protein
MSNQPMSNQPPARGGAPSSNSSNSSNNSNGSNNNAITTTTSNGTKQSNDASYRLPSNVCISHAMKLAIVEDKPIMMDYWTASLDKSVIIGVSENKDKLLVKSEDEYTSTIAKIYKVETEYIIMTENSIYIVSNDIPTKRIN